MGKLDVVFCVAQMQSKFKVRFVDCTLNGPSVLQLGTIAAATSVSEHCTPIHHRAYFCSSLGSGFGFLSGRILPNNALLSPCLPLTAAAEDLLSGASGILLMPMFLEAPYPASRHRVADGALCARRLLFWSGTLTSVILFRGRQVPRSS